MDWTLEVVVLPVQPRRRRHRVHRDRVGFALDRRTTNEHMDVAQLTPTGTPGPSNRSRHEPTSH
jgi:hypothetical protein